MEKEENFYYIQKYNTKRKKSVWFWNKILKKVNLGLIKTLEN